MRKITSFLVVLSLCFATSAFAGAITLNNADIESGPPTLFGPIADWGPNGGVADHASFARPNNGTLGSYFGYYSAGTTETVGQLTSELIQPGFTYTFSAWAQGGGDDVGTVPLQIGYAATTGDLTSFVELATQTFDVLSDWESLAGVTYVASGAGPELGKELIVRLGDASANGVGDIWFDNFSASVVPEPASLVLALFGAAAILRRRMR